MLTNIKWAFLFFACVFACGLSTAQAGYITTAQAAIIRADMIPLVAVGGPFYGTNREQEIANYYNVIAAPDWIGWVTDVPIDNIMRNGMDWTRVDNLSVGKSRIWDWMTRLGSLNCAKPNIRAGIDAAWIGTAADLAVRATVYTHCKRQATRLEKLLSGGTGTTLDPANFGYEGPTNGQQISDILGGLI